MKRVAIVGGGWAGMAAAVEAAGQGHQITVFEAARTLGGRARRLKVQRPDGAPLWLDNGQHILIGAYSASLALMQRVGVDLERALHPMPLALPYADGSGLQTPSWAVQWPAPLNAVAAIATARGWSWRERMALVRMSLRWKAAHFQCPADTTVGALCASLPERVMQELIEPLCVSALNLPAAQASAQVFLRVMQDALFGPKTGRWPASNLMLPRHDLSALFPEQAVVWLGKHHGENARVQLGQRVIGLAPCGQAWVLNGEGWEQTFDEVIWATAAAPAAQAMRSARAASAERHTAVGQDLAAWAETAEALDHTAIATVYAWAPDQRLCQPMLALRAEPDAARSPAQFVFDRGLLQADQDEMRGVMAFVVSACGGERDAIQAQVLHQGSRQLGLKNLQPLQTVIEKRATFACTPGLQQPPQRIAAGLHAAGDYVAGPYPATLEAAVRSGIAAASRL